MNSHTILLLAVVLAALGVTATAQVSVYGYSCCCNSGDYPAYRTLPTKNSPCATALYSALLRTETSVICYGNVTMNNNQLFVTAVNGTLSVIANGATAQSCTGDGFVCGNGNWNLTRSFFPAWDNMVRDNNDPMGQLMMTEYVACQILGNEFPGVHTQQKIEVPK